MHEATEQKWPTAYKPCGYFVEVTLVPIPQDVLARETMRLFAYAAGSAEDFNMEARRAFHAVNKARGGIRYTGVELQISPNGCTAGCAAVITATFRDGTVWRVTAKDYNEVDWQMAVALKTRPWPAGH